MAHPHAESRSDRRDKARAVVARTGHDVPHGKMRYAHGGAVHEDEAEDAKMIEEGVHEHESAMHKGEPKTKLKFRAGGHVDGEKARHHLGRRARGGRAGKTHVNVIVAPQGGGGMQPRGPMPAAMPPRPIAAAPPPPRPAVAPPPPGGMPGAMPGGGMGQPKPPGMMKRGGHVRRARGGPAKGEEDAADAAEYEDNRAIAGAKGGKKVVEAGTPWTNILHSKRGGKIGHRDMGGMTGVPGQAPGAAMQGQMPGAGQMTPQQQQAAQQMMAQRAAQARMNPAAGTPGMPTQKKGGKIERKHGGTVPMEAGSGGGEGRIEKTHLYGEGGFKPKEHKGEFLKRTMVS